MTRSRNRTKIKQKHDKHIPNTHDNAGRGRGGNQKSKAKRNF